MLGLFGEFEDWGECWTFFSIWELSIWHQIVVKIEIILIRISHLCIQRKVKNKQNIREKKRCNWRIIVWQNIIKVLQFILSNFTVHFLPLHILQVNLIHNGQIKTVIFKRNNLSNLFAGKLHAQSWEHQHTVNCAILFTTTTNIIMLICTMDPTKIEE